jgi:hypothetical protein
VSDAMYRAPNDDDGSSTICRFDAVVDDSLFFRGRFVRSVGIARAGVDEHRTTRIVWIGGTRVASASSARRRETVRAYLESVRVLTDSHADACCCSLRLRLDAGAVQHECEMVENRSVCFPRLPMRRSLTVTTSSHTPSSRFTHERT